MAWRPHARVRVSARNPRAAAICDRCSIPTNHDRLKWQYQYSGLRLQNLRILVCDRCLDIPNRQVGAKPISPDPIPIMNARPEPFTYTGFSYDESNIMVMPPPAGLSFGSAVDGAQMLMPDGVTVMLMPANPNGLA